MSATAYDEYQRGLHEGFAAGVNEERERCARIAETRHLSSKKYAENPYDDIAAVIRNKE